MALRRASRCSPPPTKSQSRKEQNVRRNHRGAPPLELERKKAAATPDIQHIHAIHPLWETVVRQHLVHVIVAVGDHSIPQIDAMIPVIFRCLLL
jgi:hypothetical protein